MGGRDGIHSSGGMLRTKCAYRVQAPNKKCSSKEMEARFFSPVA